MSGLISSNAISQQKQKRTVCSDGEVLDLLLFLLEACLVTRAVCF